jgi:excisionase family DNA binding protein
MGENNKKAYSELLLLTADQVAELLGFSRAHIYRLLKDGRIPEPYHFGSLVRWNKSEIYAWVNAACPTADIWETMKGEI